MNITQIKDVNGYKTVWIWNGHGLLITSSI